jgi:hypothetical protein
VEFKLDDKNKIINENAKKIETISADQIEEVKTRIHTEMESVNIEFREKQNKSIESASKAFLTF